MQPEIPIPVKLFIGALFISLDIIEDSFKRLEQIFSPINLLSPDFLFNMTDYYQAEMGSPIYRRLCCFTDLVNPVFLAEAKLICNRVELDYSLNNKRRVNLDIGYLDYDKAVSRKVGETWSPLTKGAMPKRIKKEALKKGMKFNRATKSSWSTAK